MNCNIIRQYVPNRTENWKTARVFAPYICPDGKPKVIDLANRIVSNAKNKGIAFSNDEVHLELFWKGFRDYCNSKHITKNNSEFKDKTIQIYKSLFRNLRKDIEKYNEYGIDVLTLRPGYYVANTSESKQKLFANLFNTEIDVVISIPGFLLIGEAKDEQPFGARSKHVLTHQLVRQYVMASILCKLIEEESGQKTEVIPFIIGDDLDKYAQIKLLKYMNWIDQDNIISWEKL